MTDLNLWSGLVAGLAALVSLLGAAWMMLRRFGRWARHAWREAPAGLDPDGDDAGWDV